MNGPLRRIELSIGNAERIPAEYARMRLDRQWHSDAAHDPVCESDRARVRQGPHRKPSGTLTILFGRYRQDLTIKGDEKLLLAIDSL